MTNPVDDILEHFGKKGMKWGVRNDRGHEGQKAKTKKIAKLDKTFDRNTSSSITAAKIHNAAVESANKEVVRINNKPQYKGKDFSKESPLRKQYYNEHKQAYINALEESAKSFGTNASGTKRYTIFERPDGLGWDVSTKDVSHADGESVFVKVNYDPKGHIISLEIPESTLAQTAINNILDHSGVKGMKWGVRKSSSSKSSTKRTKFKTSPKKLSNEELAKRIKRMETEKRFNDLNRDDVSEGKKLVNEVMTSVGREVAKTILTGATLQVVKIALDAKFGPGVGGAVTKRKK